MARTRERVLSSCLAALLSAGCVLPREHHPTSAGAAAAPVVETILPEVGRDDSWADPAKTPPTPMASGAADRISEAGPYRGLDAVGCQCLAARNAPTAQLLDSKRAGLAGEGGHPLLKHGHGADEVKEMAAALLAEEALVARNLAAGAALELFYRLAQAEARWHLLRLTREEVESALATTKAQLDRGFPVLPAYELLLRRRIELRGQAETLAVSIEQINGQLDSRLALSSPGGTRIWPMMGWAVAPDHPGVDESVALGLAHRSDLALLRTLSGGLDGRTAPIALGVLASLNPLLGLEYPGISRLASFTPLGESDSPRLRRQLATLTAWRERGVVEEVRLATVAVESALFQVDIARQQYLERKGEEGRLNAKSERGLARASEISATRLEVLKAHGEWVDKVVLWNIARVRLKQAQGILAEECGYSAPGAPAPPRPRGRPARASDGPLSPVVELSAHVTDLVVPRDSSKIRENSSLTALRL